MNNTYTWKIKSLTTISSPPAPINDYVVNVNYIVTGTDGKNSTSVEGNTQFPIENSNESYTDFNNLTEQQVIEWIKNLPNIMSNIQSDVDGQLQLIANPPVFPKIKNLPWA